MPSHKNHESVGRLQKELERLRNLLEVANLRIAHLEHKTTAALSGRMDLEVPAQRAPSQNAP
jgi:hypothetical protein